ncbi:hypothetical protein BLX24_29695 [Arsenicibacter rosenii]|uniref:histidine kinase n=1 Tax=Arsenicibacter rosenii TaxID=1750698 RepID=A0A1S2VA34_9BACT|nr:hypothetical protein BLX24_29695 [Arsenicibacter rosenii]
MVISFIFVDRQTTPVRGNPTVVLSGTFKEANLNPRVLFSTTFTGTPPPNRPLSAFIRQTFTANEQPDKIVLGRSYNNHQAWVFIQLVNAGDKARKLVLQAEHVRLDAITLYRVSDEKLIPAGYLTRTMPIAHRPYSFRAFALPVFVAARDTACFLLQTKRYTGLQETSLALFDEVRFVEQAIHNDFKNSFRVIYTLIIIIVMVFLASLFEQWHMFCFCGMLFGLCCIFLYMGDYYDNVPFPGWLCLSATNMGAFSVYLTNVLFLPFGFAIMKDVPVNRKWLFRTALVMGVLNISMMILIAGWQTEISNYLYTNGLVVLSVLGMCWGIYLSWLAYLRAGIVNYLFAASFAFLPFLVDLVLVMFNIHRGQLSLNVTYLNTIFTIFVLVYLTISEFRKELVTKQKMRRRLDRLKLSMDNQHKAEIEAIGRNLHDQVGNTLASALGYLNMKELKPETTKMLILSAINELRVISQNLVRDSEQPLSERIADLVSRFNTFSSTNFFFTDFTEGQFDRLPELIQQNLHAIISELMTNIIRHAHANEAHIQFFSGENALIISVEDDGVGFDAAKKVQGIGLHNIRTRASLTDLNLTIDSTPDGTSVLIEIAYENTRTHH